MSKPTKTDEDVTSTGNVPTYPVPLGGIVPLKSIFPKVPPKEDEEEKDE